MKSKPSIFLLLVHAAFNICQGQTANNYSEDQLPFIIRSQAHKIVFSTEKAVIDSTPAVRIAGDYSAERLAYSSDSKKTAGGDKR